MAEPKEEEQLPQGQSINIELSDQVAEGEYANLAMIAHSHSEFVLDFIRLMPGVPKAKVKSRIIMTPEHMKRLQQAIADNLEKYEANFGPVEQIGTPPQFPAGFGGTMGEA